MNVPIPYRTVWYKLSNAPAGTVVADTFNSTYDTLITAFTAKFTNNNVQWTEIDCNDDWQVGNLTSQIQFDTTVGETYYFMVSSFTQSAATLNVHINLYTSPPANDNWPVSGDCSNPSNPPGGVICNLPLYNSTPNFVATTQLTDPFPSCGDVAAPQKTLWFRYTPPSNVTITANTQNSTYDTILSVYTGSPGAFNEVACGDDEIGLQSKVQFSATGGVTYSFMISAFQGAGGFLLFNVDTIPRSKLRRSQLVSQ